MGNILKVLNGLEVNRSGITPASGRPLWTTDEKILYVGDGSTAGGIRVGDGVFVDLTSAQTVGGIKTLTDHTIFDSNISIGTTVLNGKLNTVTEAGANVNSYRYQSVTAGVSFNNYKARGTEGSPSACLANDRIYQWNCSGYSDTKFNAAAQAIMRVYAEETFTDTSNPTAFAFNTTAVDAIVSTEALRIASTGNVGIGTTAPLTKLHVRKSDLSIVPALNNSYIALFEGQTATNAYLPIVGDNTKKVGFRLGNPAKLDPCMIYWDNASELYAVRIFDGTSAVDTLTILKNGDVGIGQIAPTKKLHVEGDILSTTAVRVEADSAGSLYLNTANDSNSSQMIFQRSGGTQASPTAVPNGQILGAFSFRGHNGTALTGSKGFLQVGATELWTATDNGTRMSFSTTNNGTTTLVERMRIQHSGHLSVGVTSDLAQLTIGGDGTLKLKERASAVSDTSAYGQVWVKNTTPNELWFTNDSGTDVQLGAGGGGSGTVTSVGTNTGLTGTVTTSGNISLALQNLADGTGAIVGTQDQIIYLDNGTQKRKQVSEWTLSDFSNDLGWTSNSGDITGVTASTGISGGGTSGTVSINITPAQTSITSMYNTTLQVGYSSSTYTDYNSTQTKMFFSGSEEFRFTSGGNFHADANIIGNSTSISSDRKLKTNFSVIDNPIERLSNLIGMNFQWKKNKKFAHGVIAQDVEKALEYAVQEVEALNGQGTYKTVDPMALIALLIEVCKNQEYRLEGLENAFTV